MYFKTWWPTALLASVAQAQFASFSEGSYGLSVNVPENTASGNDQTIYLQISAPSEASWVGFGQGTRMSGAQMFIVYSDGNSNVTVSPRLGTGQVMPQFNSDAQVSVLEGSRVDSDGSMVANIRCDSCLSWSSGSMEATDAQSNWIWAYTRGSALDTTDTSATIRQHVDYGTFTLDLTQGTGGSSVNPFVQAADSASPSASESGSSPSASASSTTLNAPIASSNPSSDTNSASSSSADNTLTLRKSHGVIMSVAFILVFPLGALAMYLPFAKRVLLVHAPLQTIGVLLMIVGLAVGIVLGQRVSQLDAYHQIIGYIVVASLILFQPMLGLLQHLYFRRNGGRSIKGVIHQWLGRGAILLGIINGGLGLHVSGPVGSTYVPRSAVIAYGVIAGLVGISYIAVVLFAGWRNTSSGSTSPRGEKRNDRDWETEMLPRASPQQQYWQPQGQAHGTPPRRTLSPRYTMEDRS